MPSLATIIVMAWPTWPWPAEKSHPHEIRIPGLHPHRGRSGHRWWILFNAKLHELYLVLGIFIPSSSPTASSWPGSKPSPPRIRRCNRPSTASSWASACWDPGLLAACGNCWAAAPSWVASRWFFPASNRCRCCPPTTLDSLALLPPGAFILLGLHDRLEKLGRGTKRCGPAEHRRQLTATLAATDRPAVLTGGPGYSRQRHRHDAVLASPLGLVGAVVGPADEAFDAFSGVQLGRRRRLQYTTGFPVRRHDRRFVKTAAQAFGDHHRRLHFGLRHEGMANSSPP